MKRLLTLLILLPFYCLAQPSGFIKNAGQIKDSDGNFRTDIYFKYESNDLSVFFFRDKVSYVLRQKNPLDSLTLNMHRVDWNWKDCNNSQPHFLGKVDKLPLNFYYQKIEITGIESGEKIIYKNIYEGVSLIFYIKNNALKYDYVVESKSALTQIKSNYVGGNYKLSATGEFEIETSLGIITDAKPVSFDSHGLPIKSSYKYESGLLSYNVDEQVNYPITIDPEVQWSTYFGGFNFENANTIQHDDSNNVYIGGLTSSTDFPTTAGAYSTKSIGFNDCFLSKFDDEGKLIWSTYFGGTNSDQIIEFSIDSKGIIHCTSATGFGSTFPITTNARKKNNPNNGAYSRFDRNGKLLYSTFLPLSETTVATDTSGKVYFFGRSTKFFPLKGNTYQTSRKGFSDFGLLAFDDNDSLIWSTFLGGTNTENGLLNIAVNPKGDKLAISGFTSSTDFPMKKAYFDSTANNFGGFFITACFDSSGNLMWSTYLCSPNGGASFSLNDGIEFITDSKLALGYGNFQNDFPDKRNSWKQKPNLQGAFIAIFDTSGTAQRVSFDSPQSQSLGRNITDLTVDNDLNLHIVCEVFNDSIRTTADALKKTGSSFYVGTNSGELGYLIMDTSLNIKYATYIGGRKAFDSSPNISVNANNEATIVLESSNSSDFITKNAYQSRLAGSSDIVLLQFGCNYEPLANLAKGKTICKGDSIVLRVDSGQAKYNWSPKTSQTNALVAKSPGEYYVIITDSNGCSGGIKDSFVLENYGPLSPTIQALDATQFCFGDSARLRGKVSNFKSLQWSNGDTTLRTTVFRSGKYFLTASDSNGCIDTSNNINIQTIPKPNPTITSNTGSANFCRKFNEITLDVGLGYNAYKWSTGATTNSIKVSKTGWYKVVVFNGFNCSDSDSVFVRNSLATPPTIGNVNPIKFCNGDSVKFEAPIGYSNFLWSTGSRNQTIKVGNNQNVFLVASDTNGCRDTSNTITTQRIVDSLKIKANAIGPFCYDQTLNLSVDTGFSSYKWNTGDSTRAISLQQSGSYFVSALSSSGCTVKSDTFSAIFYGKTSAKILFNNSLRFCEGDSLRLYFTGPFNSFAWNNGNTTQNSIYAKISGVYTLNITDTNNCKAEGDSVKITVDPLPIVQLTSDKGLFFCERDSALISTNKSFSRYSWSNGSSKASFHINKTSRIWAEVTDNRGCSNFSDTILVTKNNLPDTTAIAFGKTSFCTGDSFIINLNDTTSNVLWNDNTTNYKKTIKISGGFKAILTNKFGCTDSTRLISINVNANPKPKVLSNGPLKFCKNLGPRILNTNNSYTKYSWSNNELTDSVSINKSGDYYVIVNDSNGCSGISDTVNITVFDLPNPVIVGLNGSSFCEGDSSFITTTKSYSKYLWSNNSTKSGFTVKSNTSLLVEVTDSNGCVNRSSPFRVSTLPLPSPFTITSVGKPAVCYPNTITLKGPQNQNKYIWSNGASGNQIALESTQKITLTVENIFGCQRQSSDSFQVYVGTAAALRFSGNSSFCLGDSFYIEATPNYTSYLWSNGNKTNSISIKSTDSFFLTTIDSIGCTFNSDTFITEVIPLQVPTPWSIARGNTELCDGDSLELLSPLGYISYMWNNGDNTSKTFVTKSGSYEVVVVDSQGCRGRSPAIDVTFFELPKPIITSLQNTFCSGDTVNLTLTQPYLNYLWSTNSFDSIIGITQNGTFNVTVQDTNQCFGKSEDFVIEFNQKPSFIVDTVSISGICDGDSLTLNINTNEETSTIAWNDQSTNRRKTIRSNETYGFTITNLAGCTESTNNRIFSTFKNPKPNIQISGNDSICEGESVVLNLANSYNQILWNNQTLSQQTILVSTEGFNYVLVTDSNNCEGRDSVFITTVALPNALLNYSTLELICPKDSILLETTNAFSSYEWNNGNTQPSIWVDYVDDFWVKVKNEFGCSNNSDTLSIALKQIPSSVKLEHNNGIISANTDSLDEYNWFKNLNMNVFERLEQESKKLRIKESNYYYLAARSKGCELISDTVYVEFYDSSKTLNFAIYPNPTLGNFLLDIDAVNPNNIWCFVIDAQGKIMKTYDLGTGDRLAQEIDIAQLNKGIYQIKIVNGDQIITQPLVKIE
ncbi:MAG: T9SS type A sorting domain-containing protein [Bacteroidia bacterium]